MMVMLDNSLVDDDDDGGDAVGLGTDRGSPWPLQRCERPSRRSGVQWT